MARFEKGQSGNPAGKPKGTKHKNTEHIRQIISEFLEKNLKDIQEEYDRLEGKDKLYFLERLLKHSIPAPKTGDLLEDMTDADLDKLIDHLKKSLN